MSLINPDALKIGSKIVRIKKKKRVSFLALPRQRLIYLISLCSPKF